jgi:hypothetical protein
MILTSTYETSLSCNSNGSLRLIDRLRRRLSAIETPTLVIWALTPLVLAAIAAVS